MQVWQESPAGSGVMLQVRACFPLCFLPPAAATAPVDSPPGGGLLPVGFLLVVLCPLVLPKACAWGMLELLQFPWSLHLQLLPCDILLPSHAWQTLWVPLACPE